MLTRYQKMWIMAEVGRFKRQDVIKNPSVYLESSILKGRPEITLINRKDALRMFREEALWTNCPKCGAPSCVKKKFCHVCMEPLRMFLEEVQNVD